MGFADRLERLPRHEGKIVKRALTSLGAIPTLSDKQFDELGRAVLGAWEHGRLTELIAEIADSEELDESALLEVLMEARVLTALQTVEVVRTKLEAIQGLRKRIEEKELENAVRDFIAKSPWLISAEWETFKKESGLRQIIEKAADTAKLSADVYRGRVDLTLASGQHLLILEFVRPGQAVDWDHLSRFERYVRSIRSRIKTTTGASFRQVTGYIVADNGASVLHKAEAGWRDFLMRAVGRNDTRPELRLRRALWSAGLRYRLQRKIAGTRPISASLARKSRSSSTDVSGTGIPIHAVVAEAGRAGRPAAFFRCPGDPPCRDAEPVFLRAGQEARRDGRQGARAGPWTGVGFAI